MLKIDRKKGIAVALLGFLVVVSIATPFVALKARSDAIQDLDDQQKMKDRLESAHRRVAGKIGADTHLSAPPKAFMTAETLGLAGAQLETYFDQLAVAQQANIASSGPGQSRNDDAPGLVRIQATMTINYNALQPLLYQLETGTPYVFIDSIMMQPPTTSTLQSVRGPVMRVSLNLHALWHRSQP